MSTSYANFNDFFGFYALNTPYKHVIFNISFINFLISHFHLSDFILSVRSIVRLFGDCVCPCLTFSFYVISFHFFYFYEVLGPIWCCPLEGHHYFGYFYHPSDIMLLGFSFTFFPRFYTFSSFFVIFEHFNVFLVQILVCFCFLHVVYLFLTYLVHIFWTFLRFSVL